MPPFSVKWDGKYVAGVCRIGSLKRTNGVIKRFEGGDPSSSRRTLGRTECEATTVERRLDRRSDGGR